MRRDWFGYAHLIAAIIVGAATVAIALASWTAYSYATGLFNKPAGSQPEGAQKFDSTVTCTDSSLACAISFNLTAGSNVSYAWGTSPSTSSCFFVVGPGGVVTQGATSGTSGHGAFGVPRSGAYLFELNPSLIPERDSIMLSVAITESWGA
jgi:hypothetical protein